MIVVSDSIVERRVCSGVVEGFLVTTVLMGGEG